MRNDPVHDTHILGETPARRLESGTAADFLVSRALRERLVLAVKTLPAGNVMKSHDSVAESVVLNPFAYRCDDSRSLMSENAWGGVRACGNLFEIGAADSTGVHADEHFPGADGGDGYGFEADVVQAAIDRCLHSRGDRVLVRLDRILSGYGHLVILDEVWGAIASKQGRWTPKGNLGGFSHSSGERSQAIANRGAGHCASGFAAPTVASFHAMLRKTWCFRIALC